MATDIASPRLGWNVARDVSELVEYHFMVNALLAGGIVAVMAGLVGWVMVLRREAFAGHTLAMMAFPGASAAALIGIPAAWGYFAFCGAGGLAIGRLSGGEPGSWSEESAAIGAVQASALAAGFLFVSLYGGVLGGLESLLFGNILGVSDGQVLLLALVAAGTLAALAALGRPLLFASVDPDVASARGVPVRALSGAFLLLLGLAVAATSQITGPLLVFALLVMPAATRAGDHGAPRAKPCADGGAGAGGDVARAGSVLLLALSGGLLHIDRVVRDLRARSGSHGGGRVDAVRAGPRTGHGAAAAGRDRLDG
jgi:zinc/manganese transport system permease protein